MEYIQDSQNSTVKNKQFSLKSTKHVKRHPTKEYGQMASKHIER